MEQNENCHFEEQVMLYAYGELSRRDALRVENHIKECDSCRRTVSIIKKADEIITSEKQLPRDSTVRFILANAQKRQPVQTGIFFKEKILAFSLAAIFIVSGYVLMANIGNHQWQETAYMRDSQSLISVIDDEELDFLEEEISDGEMFAEENFWE